MNSEPKHFNIVIATPGRDMVAPYVKSLAETFQYLNDNKISFYWANDYSPCIGLAREKTFYNFYIKNGKSSTYNKMIWIDSDISWTIEDFMNLYNSPKQIVSGTYLTFPNEVAAHKNPRHAFTIDEIEKLNDYEKVMYCGMGFLSVNYGIIENIENPFLDVTFIFEKEKIKIFGEDVAFCIKAQQQLGKEIWLDPKIRVNHHKIQPMRWS